MKPYRSILIATDGSNAASYAARQGLILAGAIGAKVEFIYVLDDLSYALPVMDWDDLEYPMNLIKEAAFKGANKALDRLEELAEELGVETTRKVLTGSPAQTIIDEAAHFDLLVLGTMGRSEIVEYLLGGVANKIVKHVKIPVLLVRYPKEKIKKRKLADD